MSWINKLLFITLLFFCSSLFAREKSFWDFSLNGQLYPAGFISTVSAQKSIGLQSLIGLRLGHNLLRHGNLGVQDNERGHGFGFSIDYTHYLKKNHISQWYATVRNDIWFNSVDWKNNLDQPSETSGNTDIIVAQPTLEIGYTFINNKNFFIRPNLAFGVEINVDTQGEDVGEGMIGLIGISFGWRKTFQKSPYMPTFYLQH
ncbi:MAG TPA: hypothetical protein PKC21_09910 [Oligoflexia bacterium]|nr:hypothetical protein [Oligoflexia bacterium]HMR25654.1 hypothetical protein [Oligoflexia bacterium]